MADTAQGAERIGLGRRIGYGAGDFAFNLGYQTTALFLLYFFTDVFGIPPAAAGTIFLVSKLWDAVTDPAMGIVTDHTRSRWGSKRPYLLFGAVPYGLSVALLFSAPQLASGVRTVWGYATFILFCTAITVVNIPYGAITAVMTRDANGRAELSAWRMGFALFGTLLAAGASRPVVDLFGGGVAGFRALGILWGIVGAVITLVAFFSSREGAAPERQERETLRRYLRTVTGNAPFLLLCLSTVFFMIGVNMLAAVVSYWFKYNLGNESGVTLALVALFVTAIAFIPLFLALSKRLGKKPAFLVGIAALALCLVCLFAVGGRSLPLTLGLFVLGGVGMSTMYLCPWSMVPDTVEYSEWKTGLRREGILYGVFFFCFKVGAAVAGWLTGLGLDVAGYAANAVQTDRALRGIHILITLVPLAFIALGTVVLWFYPITLALHRRISAEVASRGSASPSTGA
jgi:GPH family glycoside/pentoside/hexuronide:cation symporter